MFIHNIFNSIYAMKLGGKFSFVSQEGDGSTFLLTCRSKQYIQIMTKKILFVEDDLEIRTVRGVGYVLLMS